MGRKKTRTYEDNKKYHREWARKMRAKNDARNIGKWLNKSRWLDGWWDIAGRFFNVRSSLQGIEKWGAEWGLNDSLSLSGRKYDWQKYKDRYK